MCGWFIQCDTRLGTKVERRDKPIATRNHTNGVSCMVYPNNRDAIMGFREAYLLYDLISEVNEQDAS